MKKISRPIRLFLYGIFLFLPIILLAHTEDEYDATVIRMVDGEFVPDEVVIDQGDTVVFKNADATNIWPASNIHPTHRGYPGTGISKCNKNSPELLFDSCGPIQPSEEWEFTFNESGEWRYHDHIRSEANGLVKVIPSDDFESEDNQIDKLKPSLWFTFVKFYYKIFPQQLSKKLISLNFIETSKNEDELYMWLQIISPKEYMDRMLEETDGGSSLDCHSEAHEVGRMAYSLYGGKAFGDGDASCHSGYYHGAIEIFISQNGTDNFASSIDELCSLFSTRFGNFECLHGVGHGVLAYQDYNLPTALGTCKLLKNKYSARSCFGGVFMENVVVAQGNGVTSVHETEWLNEDPYFPCNSLEEFDERHQCSLMQTSWMLSLNNYDFEKVGNLCLGVSQDMINVCFQSLGRDAAGNALRDPKGILERCSSIPTENGYYGHCITGAVNVIIDFWGPNLEKQADEFCDTVSDETVKYKCKKLVEFRKSDFN